MVKNSPFNRMPKKGKSLPGNDGGKDSDDESDSSVDSHGNLRDLIDYGSDSEEPSPRPIRKAALLARKKIDLIMKKSRKADKADKADKEDKEDKMGPRNTIHYPTVKRRLYHPVSPSIYSPKSSTEEDMEETLDEETEEDEIDIEETDEEPEMEETDQENDSNEEEQNEELFRYILKMGDRGENKSMVPKKYNMKLEPESVQRFVTLLTAPVEENTIDTQICQFKEMTEEKQSELLHALENRPTINNSGINLMLRILTMKLPQEVQAIILAKYNSLQSLEQSSNEYFKLRAWLDKVVSIPFGTYKEIPVRLEDGPEKCGDFMRNSKKCLDDSVYGQEDSKLQIMQFISSKIANPNSRGLCLLLTGPPGVGKTSLIKNGIAKALGWPFQFISLGGDSDASTYTGHQLVYESSHCGKIVNSLIASKSMSTVLMFDEVDKISQTPKGEEIMNLLIHLTDPVQNSEFEDKYLAGIPIDLSKVMFVFSANDITKIDRVLLDRMVVITLKGYDLKQKTTIAEQYLLPDALNEVNLVEKVAISKEILTQVIEDYAHEEKGVRELKRCIEQMTQKINMLRMYNSPDLPFYIKDFTLPFIVKKDHVPLFLKKKEAADLPPYGMYT
jgi:ATP-dependent Lon protease